MHTIAGRFALGVLVLGAVASQVSAASAQARQGETRFGGHFVLGLGGEAEVDGPRILGVVDLDGESDLLTTFGFGFQGEHAVHEYVLLGIRGELAWWNTEDWDDSNLDRNLLMDFGVQVKGRYAFPIGRMSGEVFAVLPVGLAIDIPDDDWENVDTGLGWHVAVLGGFALMLSPDFGVFSELGFQWHGFTHEHSESGADWDVSMSQFVMHFGVLLGT